jgi:DNA-binding transcriptional regulator LsrR (DeoR family)
LNNEERDELLVTVASLYYELNQNQQQIADRLEVSRSSVSRLIKEARDRGIVEIFIHKSVAHDFTLEQELINRFGLKDAYVLRTAPGTEEGTLLRAVGRLAAGYLQRVIAALPVGACIGIAWGTGVHAAVSALNNSLTQHVDVVQIMGGVGAPDPLIDGPDLARMVAGKLGGRHYYLHAPVLVEHPHVREMLLAEPTVREGIQRAQAVELAILGIGTVQEEASSFLRTGHLTRADLAYLRNQGIVGEMCGRFFDAQGCYENFEINRRIIGLELNALRRIPRVLAVARGLLKAQSILGALRGKYLTVLATDDITARAVLALAEHS